MSATAEIFAFFALGAVAMVLAPFFDFVAALLAPCLDAFGAGTVGAEFAMVLPVLWVIHDFFRLSKQR